MRRRLGIALAVAVAVVLFLGLPLAALIGLNAECSGSISDCHHSEAYRIAVLATPVAAALILVDGGVRSIRRRSVRPLVVAEAAAVGLTLLLGGVLDGFDGTTFVWLAVATVVAAAALRPAH